jgi:hypothetical protein
MHRITRMQHSTPLTEMTIARWPAAASRVGAPPPGDRGVYSSTVSAQRKHFLWDMSSSVSLSVTETAQGLSWKVDECKPLPGDTCAAPGSDCGPSIRGLHSFTLELNLSNSRTRS